MRLTRSETVRGSNDHIVERAVRFHFVSRVPILCECSDPDCRVIIPMSLSSYAEHRASGFFTAPGHRVVNGELAVQHDGYWLQEPRAYP